MADAAFELIPQSKVRIEGRILSINYCDPPLEGKYRYLMDGTSDERDKICQHVFVHEFRNIFPTDLPNGFSLTIEQPRSDFRQINSVNIKKLDDLSKLVVTLYFSFSDWHLPLNLSHFAEAYCSSLRENVENETDTYVEPDNLGVYVCCGVSVSSTTSFFSAYRKAEAQILATYRTCLADVYKPAASLKKDTKQVPSVDVSGAKWWVKYVIVPVLGSGSVAAIAAGLMALLK